MIGIQTQTPFNNGAQHVAQCIIALAVVFSSTTVENI